MPAVLITGATGMVGSALLPCLQGRDSRVRAAYRAGNMPAAPQGNAADLCWVSYDLEDNANDYGAVLDGIDIVVHLAARVHAPGAGDDSSYAALNRQATQRLAAEAAARGVRRFILLSTIKVNGEKTPGEDARGHSQRFTEIDPPRPLGAYAISKHEAEQAVMEICRSSGMEYVILRPPLVYGPRVKANFLRLLDAVASGVPLPLGALHNRRSLLYSGNLAHAIRLCMEKPGAANQVYLVSDQDLTLPELIREMAECLGRSARLFPVPAIFWKMAFAVPQYRDVVGRLTESLLIDNAKISDQLGWAPPVTLRAGMQQTVDWYRTHARR